MNIFGCQVLQSIVVHPGLGVLGIVEELVDFTSGNVSKIDRHKTVVTTSGSSVQDTVSVLAEALAKVLVGRDRLQRDDLVRVFVEFNVHSSQSKEFLYEHQLYLRVTHGTTPDVLDQDRLSPVLRFVELQDEANEVVEASADLVEVVALVGVLVLLTA